MKKKLLIPILAAALLCGGAMQAHALTASTRYTITVSKLTPAGTLYNLETVSAATDSAGKLTFSLTSLPTNTEVNFVVFTIKDTNGSVVRQGIVPAPPAGDLNKIGINDLATVQASAFLKAAELAGTDDPVMSAYLLVLLRSPNITADDILKLGGLGKTAITGNNGFEAYLSSKGISAAKISALKACLIDNPDTTKKTLRDFAKGFYTAVESTSTSTATEEMQKAGGIMADIFMDAAACADIDLSLISQAHNAAGDAAEATGYIDSQSPNAMSGPLLASIDQSMSAFGQKIRMVQMVTDYSNALSALNASGAQVTSFISAATTLAQASTKIDVDFGGYFVDPQGYAVAHQTTVEAIRQQISDKYTLAWNAFQQAIMSSNTDISAMKSSIIAAIPGIQLPPDFGKYYDMNGQPVNWPVQQVVTVNWLIGLVANGGTLGYTRDTTTIPTQMVNWMGACSNTNYWDKGSCEQNGGTWTGQRHTFSTPSTAFNNYLAIQEDVNIAEMTRDSIWSNNSEPTNEQRAAAEAAFANTISNIRSKIVATKNGTGTAVTDAEKSAIIKLMLHPNT